MHGIKNSFFNKFLMVIFNVLNGISLTFGMNNFSPFNSYINLFVSSELGYKVSGWFPKGWFKKNKGTFVVRETYPYRCFDGSIFISISPMRIFYFQIGWILFLLRIE